MINKSETQEKQYLEKTREKLLAVIKKIDEGVMEKARSLKEDKEYLYEHKTGMDRMEKLAMQKSIAQSALLGEAALEKRKRLAKLLDSPYFGRIDFSENGQKEAKPIYIGIHSYFDEDQNANIIHDWRAPISSMYYDFELGKAHYASPSGTIAGEILLKRQYRIRKGRMEFMLENSLNIHDDILQKELSKASDDKMKHIVATIQRDQNAIIRNESSYTLIIQGVAGSGKTSIALHRIAFLLYRFRENISSKEILIISPNKVFADYISNVLPELGEEKIPEMGMEELANEALDKKVRFQTFHEQVNALLTKKDEAFRQRISFKASFEFVRLLDQYLAHIENHYFSPADFWIRKNFVPDWFIKEKYATYHRIPLLKRFEAIAKDVEENIRFYYRYDINAAERNEIRKAIEGMFRITNLRQLYKDFYDWLEKPDMFKQAARAQYEWADVFPLIYMKIRLEGHQAYTGVKHLLVDEMQDYTPVQYAVLSRLFICKKTILGDANQTVNPYSSTSAIEIQKVFPESDIVTLLKSYRSTYEITNFAQGISRNDELVAIERRGEEPGIIALQNEEAEIEAIRLLINDFRQSDYRSLGIICKTWKQAEWLHNELEGPDEYIYLLSAQSASFAEGVILTTAHMAKGLEFDQVVVPFATTANYKNSIDKSMLYIACTRAMHKLSLTHTGKPSGILPNH
jgi:DNA helicase II / ATP-dependent DNA helicase PcrA